ncbi:hypothetical protein T09_9716, partial [Trichinella sp. T9]
MHVLDAPFRGISQKIGQDTSKDMEGIQEDSQMIKSDALHKQIAFYDCHDLKTNGTKEWHVGNIIPLFKSSIFKRYHWNYWQKSSNNYHFLQTQIQLHMEK